MVKTYKIADILHSGKSGKRNVPKVGEKYDGRRNQIINIDLNEYNPGDILVFNRGNKPYIFTTPFVKAEYVDDNFLIETINSIYVMESVNE